MYTRLRNCVQIPYLLNDSENKENHRGNDQTETWGEGEEVEAMREEKQEWRRKDFSDHDTCNDFRPSGVMLSIFSWRNTW